MNKDDVIFWQLFLLCIFLIAFFVMFLKIDMQQKELSKSYIEYSKLNDEFREYKRDCLFYKKQENERR